MILLYLCLLFGSSFNFESMYLLYLHLLFASSFKFDSTLPPLAPGIHWTTSTGPENVTFHKIDLPITRVGLSVGVSLSGENPFET